MSEKAVSSAVKQSLSLAELADPLMKELRDKLDRLFANEAMERFTHVLCTGCGDSYIAGVAATPAFHTLTDITVEVLPTPCASESVFPGGWPAPLPPWRRRAATGFSPSA